jgi:hypothetical protein
MRVIKSVFVVLKNGRRLEDVNYATKQAATQRLNSLREQINKAYVALNISKDTSSYEVRKVDKPNKIW